MKLKDRPIITFLILFLGMELFSYIFFDLFNINFNTKNELIRIFVDFLFILIIFLFVYKDDLIKDGHDYIKNFKSIFITSIIYYIVGLLGMYISNYLIGIIFTQASAGNEESVRALIDEYPLYMFFSVTIYAPFVEEIVFRKSIFNIFKKMKNEKLKKVIYIITSGLVFALLHIISSVETIYDYIYVIPYLSLGIALATIYYKTNNIYSTMVMHLIHNLLAFILYIGVGSIL